MAKDVFEQKEGIVTAKGDVFEILQGIVAGLNGKDYTEEIDGEFVLKRNADVLVEKGILKAKKKKKEKKEDKTKKKDK